MRYLYYSEEDIELVQFVAGEDWFVFTKEFVMHAPINRLLSVLEQMDEETIYLEELDQLNAVESYKEEHYPEMLNL